MADDLAGMFAEASEEADVDIVEVDNLEEFEADEVEDEPVEDIDVDDETDTDEEEPEDDDLDDDESPEDVVEDDDFNWDEIEERYGDKLVKLVVNGQEVEKPLRELRNMAMMREDYSRKTAEVAQAARAAQWAQQVQESFEADPIGTLQAFAKAYGIDVPVGSQEPESDPYEDFDPEIAAVLRKMDEQEQRHQQELERVRAQTEAITEKELLSEIKQEVAVLKDQFGDDLDELEMLRVAAYYNMPLQDAAYRVMGEKYWSMSESEKAAAAKAQAATAERSSRKNGSAKKRAASTSKRGFDGAGPTSISKDDFANIGELFEIELNSTS